MKTRNVLLLACGIFVLIVTSAFLAVRYMFPAEEVRRQLEHMLSQQLQSDVRIGDLEWDLFSGIRLDAVHIEQDGVRVIRLNRLVLRYDLTPLLHGKLSINELILTRAEIFLDLTRKPIQAETEPVQQQQTPITLPTLPIMLNIEALRIEDSQIGVAAHDGLRLTLRHADLSATLSAGPTKADLSGTFDVADIDVVQNTRQWQFPLHIEYALGVDLPAERLVINHLSVQSNPVMSLSLKGQVDHIVSSREITLSIQEGRIDLERLLPFAQPFLPPPFANMRVAGTIMTQMTIKGSQTGEGFDGTVEADLKGTDLQGAIPSLQFALQPTSFHVHTGETPIHANLPRSIRADVSIHSAAASLGTSSMRNLAVEIQAGRTEPGQVSAHMTMAGMLSASLPPAMQSISEPVTVEIDASGSESHMSFSLAKLTVRIGHLLDVVASGEIGALKEAAHERPFTMKTSIEIDVAKLASVLPRSMLEGVRLVSHSSRQKLALSLAGALDPEWHPQQAHADVLFEAAGLQAALADFGVSGTLDQMAIDAHANYGSKTGALLATLSGVMGFADMKYKTSLALGSAFVKFTGQFQGRATPERGFSNLTASHRLELDTHRIQYDSPGITGRLDGLTASSDIDANIMEGVYRLKSLRIIAKDFLDCSAKGEFRPNDQHFSLDFSMPLLNMNQIGHAVSGPDVQAFVGPAPSGHLSLNAQGFGTMPKPEQIAALRIPVTVSVNMGMHDIAGTFLNRTITGLTGEIHMAMDHAEHQKVTSSAKIQAHQLDMGSGLPIQQINKLSIDLGLSATDFNDLTLDRLIVGANGADVTLEGEVSGINRLLMRADEPLSTRLGPIFIKIRSSVNLDLDRFQDALHSLSLAGSGRAGLNITLLKKESGPLDVRLNLLPRRLSVAKDSNRIEDLDGTINVRKVLQWMPSHDRDTPDASLSPTHLLPDLRAASPSRHDLRIRQVEAGPLRIRDLSAGLFLDRNRLVLQDLAMTVLGGGLGGEIAITGGKSFGLNMRLEAAGVDMNQLLPPEEQIQGNSLIDGTLTLSAMFDASDGRLDVGRSKLDVSLSRIGQDSLDRVLHFLDPKGSNPSIVSARSSVHLANPSSAHLTLSKGLAGVQILFEKGLLSRFEMDRIPFGQIKQVQNLTQNIPQWEMIRHGMEILGAERYGVGQSGEFIVE